MIYNYIILISFARPLRNFWYMSPLTFLYSFSFFNKNKVGSQYYIRFSFDQDSSKSRRKILKKNKFSL